MSRTANLSFVSVLALALAACSSSGSADGPSGSGGVMGQAGSGVTSAGSASAGQNNGGSANGGMSSGGNASAGTAGSAPTAGTAPSGGMGSAGVDAGGTGGSGGSGGSGGGGGSGTGSPHLFGSHKFAYAPGTILPTGSAASLDKATADFYDVWKATYLKAGCGGFYVAGGAGLDGDPGIFAVSEGEGYGMVIVPLMAGHDPDAQAAFDGLYRAFRKVPSVNDPDLAGWEMMNNSAGTCTSTTTTTDTFDDSATDGDLDTAFGLLLANAQWGSAGAINYLAEAKKVILAIKAHDVNPTSKLLMLGDWADIKAPYYATRYTATPGPYNDPASTAPQEAHPRYYWGTRPSDYMMDHLRAFQAAAADTSWSAVIDAHYALMASMQTKYSATSGLIPDFITDTDKTAAPAQGYYLEAASDGAVGYNSCRVPWHLGTDFAVTGEARAKAALAPLNAWIRKLTGDDPSKIVDGYSLAGKATGSGNEVVFVAPLGVGAMVDAKNQAWLDAIWAHVVAQKKTEYYGDTVKMLNLLVMSNNWFQP